MDRNFKIYHFENGFKLFLLKIKKGKDSLLYSCVDILCGSDLENKTNLEHGHFLEHLNGFFTSSKYPDGKKNELILNELGISTNASVTSTITSYYMSGLSENKDIIIDMLLHSFVDFKIDKKILSQERNAVIKELEERRNNTWNTMYQKENEIKYPGHFRKTHIIDYKARILSSKKATSDDLLLFRNTHYKTERTMLTLAGDYGSKNEIIKKIEKLLKTKLIRKPKKLDQYKNVFPIIKPPVTNFNNNSIHFIKNKNAKTSKLLITFKLPFSAFSYDKLKLNLVSNLLSRGLSSILKRVLRSKFGLIYYISTNEDTQYNESYSYFDISTEVSHDKIPFAIDLIIKEIKKLKNKIITNKQFNKLKNSVNYDFAKRKYTDKLSYWANTYFFRSIWNRKVLKIKALKKLYKKITKKQLKTIINKCFNKKTMKIIYSGNGKDLSTKIINLKSIKNFDN